MIIGYQPQFGYYMKKKGAVAFDFYSYCYACPPLRLKALAANLKNALMFHKEEVMNCG